MKITLVNPNYNHDYPQYCLGLLQLASVIRQCDWDVQIVDANVLNLTPEQTVKKIPADTDIVGLTSMTPSVRYSFKVAELLRDTEVFTFFGGAHLSALPEQTMHAVPDIDIGVVGEGETTIRELLRWFEKSGNLTLKDIKGIIWRDNDRLVMNDPRPYITHLDDLPLPAYDLLEHPISQYKAYPPHPNPFCAIISSRGCPYNCIFCSKVVFGRQYNCFSADYIFNQIKYVHDTFHVNHIQFYDDSFTLDKKRVEKLCQLLIDNKLDIMWSCETRVNLVNRAMLNQMKKAGCDFIYYGIESGVQKTLKYMNKQITLEQITTAVKTSAQVGISVIAYMMMGFPHETKEEIMESIRFITHLPVEFVQWSIVTPFYGTRLYEECKTFNPELESNTAWENWVYSDLTIKNKRPLDVHTSQVLSIEELHDLQKLAYRTFYFRPRYIMKMGLRSLTSWSQMKANVNGFKALLSIPEVHP